MYYKKYNGTNSSKIFVIFKLLCFVYFKNIYIFFTLTFTYDVRVNYDRTFVFQLQMHSGKQFENQ